MKFEPFFKFLVDLNIFGETEFPFYDISGLCVNVNNAMSADKYACTDINLEMLCMKHGEECA